MRVASVKRVSRETEIELSLNLDQAGTVKIDVPNGFLAHMLELWAFHGGFGLECRVKGDTEVDLHHTVEDTGICLGQAFKQALGDRKGIRRYGSFTLPMDEARVSTHLDISGRPWSSIEGRELFGQTGGFDAQLLPEFLRAFAIHAGITLQQIIEAGVNLHHILEAAFKSLARALRIAVTIEGDQTPSSKGLLD